MDAKYNIRGTSMKVKKKIKILQGITNALLIFSVLAFCFALGLATGQNMRNYDREFEYKSPEQCLNVCVELFERMGC